jgi:hypothetical protein
MDRQQGSVRELRGQRGVAGVEVMTARGCTAPRDRACDAIRGADFNGSDWENWYRALKAQYPDEYFKALAYAGGIAIEHKLPTKVAAEYERAMVILACELLGVAPS